MTAGSLANPLWLLLLPLPWWLLWRYRGHLGEGDTAAISLLHPLLERLPAAEKAGAGKAWWLYALALSLMLLALARPQWQGDWLPPPAEGREIVLLVDVSPSMDLRDFSRQGEAVARMSVLKGAVRRFVQQRQADRFSLVTFAEHTATLVPMTDDRTVVDAMVQRLQPGLLGDGTAIGDGLALALQQLQSGSGKRRLIILFSDGTDTGGHIRPAEALALAHDLDAVVYTVMVSAEPVAEAAEEPTVEEPTLTDIAKVTDGRYFDAASAEGLDEVIASIDRQEAAAAPPPSQRRRHEGFALPLLAGLLLLALARFSQVRRT